MRSLTLILLLATPLAFAGSSRHSTHIVNSDGLEFEIQVIRDGDDAWATFKRDGVRYITRDESVIDAIDKAMEPQRELGQAHSELGRQHSELGREHSELGREQSRLGREHSRASRDGVAGEERQRELEAEQRKLEDKQRKLEDKQRALEDKQRALEDKQRAIERDVNEKIQKIFEKAVRDGKARREND